MVLGILISIVAGVLILGLVAMTAAAARRRGSGAGSVDAHTVRRIFQYVVLYSLCVVVAIGSAELIGRLLGARAAR